MRREKAASFLCWALLIFPSVTFAQGTAFNFQGRLNDGSSLANGHYDLQFRLFDQIAGGIQVGPTLTKPDLVLINGVFSTTLDFGGTSFTGADRFVEISVRPAGSPNAYVILGTRQQILSVPFSIRAINAVNADSATSAAVAANAQNSFSLGGLPSSSYARLNFANQGDVSAANLGAQGYISVGGNALQPVSSNGFPKAMAYVTDNVVNPPAAITRCYNGVTGVSTGGCGFTVTEPLGVGVGVYRLNFGFSVAGRFAVVTAISDRVPLRNVGATVRFNGGDLEVFTFVANDPNDTSANDFIVAVY